MKKGRLYALIIFVIAVVGSAIYVVDFLYKKEQTAEAFYRTSTASVGDIVLKTVASGSIQPRHEILIKPQVSGIIGTVLIEPGDTVMTGDVLVEVNIVPNMSALSGAENRLSRAHISLDDAKRTYERNSALFDQGVLSAMDLQRDEISLKQAEEELLSAKDNLRIVKEGVTARGGATSNTQVRATIDGMVLDVPIKKGNSVIEANNFNDGTTIAAVADMRDLIFVGKIDESEVEKLQGQVDQQAQQAASQADQEAQVDQQHQAEIQQAQQAADSLDQTQEQEIDINQQKIAQVDQRLGKLEQIVQQVSSQLNQPSAPQQAAPQQPAA